MAPARRLRVISLGGGVQSTVMALMASEGALKPMPDCAIFADTGWEPPTIYDHLEWLSDTLRFPIHVVDSGRSLRDDARALVNHSGNSGFLDIPVFLKGQNGNAHGMGRRQCTEHYKIRPIRRKLRQLLGLRPRQRIPFGTTVELWLGISTDEAIRIKASRDRWIHNRYPLAEAGMSRQDCLGWWSARYDRPLERSACIGCPYQSRRRWIETKRRFPGLFAETIEIDSDMRRPLVRPSSAEQALGSDRGLAFAKEPYLHPRRIPLAEAVSLDEAQAGLGQHRDGFGNECEGHCGV